MKKTKVLLIAVITLVVLMLATMLTVGAETPVTDAAAAEAGYVARVGDEGEGAYYKKLSDAVSAAAGNDKHVVLIADYKQSGTIELTNGASLTLTGVKKADGTYTTLTRASGTTFKLTNGAKLFLDKINLLTDNGDLFDVTGPAAISAEYNADGYSADSTVVVVGSEATAISTDSKGSGYMFKVGAGYVDMVVKGKVAYTGNDSGKNMYVFRADNRAWTGKLTIFGEVSLTATKTTDWYHLVRARQNGSTIDVRDGAVLTLNLTGDAGASKYANVNALFWHHGTTLIGNATLNSTQNVIHVANDSGENWAKNAEFRLQGEPDYSNVKGKFVSASSVGFKISMDDAAKLGFAFEVGGKYFSDFNSALAACGEGEAVVLFNDYVVTSTITISQHVTLKSPDGQMKKLIQKNSAAAFKITYGSLTFENIEIEASNLFIQTYHVVNFGEGTVVTVNSSNRFVYVLEGGTVNFCGADINVIYVSNNFVRNDNGTVNVTGGSITIGDAGNDVFRIRGEFNMTGGTLINNSLARNTFYLTGENNTASVMNVSGGTIINQNYVGIYADGGVINVTGGTVVQHAACFVNLVGTSACNVNGGVFVADRASSAASSTALSLYLFYKNSKTASMNVTGGLYLLYERDYIYYSNTKGDSVVSYPESNLAFLKNDNSVILFGDNEYYFMSYNDCGETSPTASKNVTLDVATNALTFTINVTKANRAAIAAWASKMAGDASYVLTYGAVIAAINDVYAAQHVTMATFDALGLSYTNVTVADAEGEDGFAYTATKSDFTAATLGEFYTVVPYVVVTIGEESVLLYGSYHTDTSASVSDLAFRQLHNVTDVVKGEYVYESIAVAHAYSPYTKEQQEALVALMAHVHTNDYKGVCSICGADNAIDLVVDGEDAYHVYMKYSNEYNFRLELKGGVSYDLVLSDRVANLVLYNADGVRQTLVDGRFVCAADGVYYLKASAALVGDAMLSVVHVHVTDFQGYCSVCAKSFVDEIATEVVTDKLIKKGNNYYYVVELLGGMRYQILTVNGTYVVCDVEGNAMSVSNSIMLAPADGLYYVKVNATFSGKGSIVVKHVHAYDDEGVCVMPGCGNTISVTVKDTYTNVQQTFKKDSKAYFTITLENGLTYVLKSDETLGVWTIYDPEGNEVTLDNQGKFVATMDGVYRLILECQVDTTCNLWFEVEHTCVYDPNGVCPVCHEEARGVVQAITDGKSQAKSFKAGRTYYFTVDGMLSGASYAFTLLKKEESMLGKATVVFYAKDGDTYTEIETIDGVFAWSGAEGDELCIVLTANEDIDANIQIAHIHQMTFRGTCSVSGCSKSDKVFVSVDSPVKAQYKIGETYYYFIEFPGEGDSFRVKLEGAQGEVVIYEATGEIVEPDENGIIIAKKMCYYVVVTATAESEANAKFTFEKVG